MNILSRFCLFCGAAAILAFPALAQKKNKDHISDAVLHAKYVYVEAYDGPEWSPRLTSEDRKAIVDVENAVRSWRRYELVLRRSEAEMVIQVRKGRVANARAGGGISVDQVPKHVQFPPPSGTDTQTTTHGDAGVEVGPPDDLLFVYMSDGGQLGARLWQRTQPDGLQAPDLKLFQRFKDEVNASANAQSKKKTASPAATPPSQNGTGAASGSPTSPNPPPNPPNHN